MRLIVAALIGSIGVVASALLLPATSTADPSDDPCPLAVPFLCRVLPIAPELDGDVDLTKQVPLTGPAAPAPDSLPSAEICASGCV
jgi:hypothetical protein